MVALAVFLSFCYKYNFSFSGAKTYFNVGISCLYGHNARLAVYMCMNFTSRQCLLPVTSILSLQDSGTNVWIFIYTGNPD